MLNVRVFVIVSTILSTGVVGAQRPAPATPHPEMVVSTEWLAAHANDPAVAIIEVLRDSSYWSGHIPNARALPYSNAVVRINNLSSELPAADVVKTAFEALGVSDSTLVVVYASEAPMATRVLFTLIANGHNRVAYLDGGLPKWRREGRAVSRDVPRVTAGSFTPHPRADLVVDADWISARAGKKGIALVDTRTDGEYVGAGERSGMPSAGHLTGARQLQWEQLYKDGGLELVDRPALAQLYSSRMQPGDTVVTYCWVGYRASATWFAAYVLGHDAKFYDGSYQDWLARKLPVVAGQTP